MKGTNIAAGIVGCSGLFFYQFLEINHSVAFVLKKILGTKYCDRVVVIAKQTNHHHHHPSLLL